MFGWTPWQWTVESNYYTLLILFFFIVPIVFLTILQLYPCRYAAVFAALVSGLACLVGIDFGAKLLASLAKCFEVHWIISCFNFKFGFSFLRHSSSRLRFSFIFYVDIRTSIRKKTIFPCGIWLFFSLICTFLEFAQGYSLSSEIAYIRNYCHLFSIYIYF